MKKLNLLIFLFALTATKIFGQPANDNCANAIAINNLTTAQTVSVDLSGAMESLIGNCEDSTENNVDVWYQFTMPFDGKLRVSNIHGINRISLYHACGGAELACFWGDGYVDGLTHATTYYLRYSGSTPGLYSDNITVQVFAPPSNDDCTNAILISGINNEQVVSLDNQGAHESLDASCENGQDENLDLWYKFVMPFDGKIKITGVSIVQMVSLYDQCGGSELGCMFGSGFFNNLSSGQEYYLRYATRAEVAWKNNVYIHAFEPPPNDECANAINIPNIQSAQTISMEVRGATESLDASCDVSSDDNFDLWYSFTMPFSGKVKFSNLSIVNRVSLYDACGGNEIVCRAGTGFVEGLFGGTQYVLRFNTPSTYAHKTNIVIQAFAPPVNDACTDATVIGDISTAQTVVLDTRGASERLDASCENANQTNLDLWYQFDMPFDGKVEFSGVFGGNRLTLYDSCGGPELECLKGNGFFYGLNGGKRYTLRYAAIAEHAAVDQIVIQAFPTVVNDDCEEAIIIPNLTFKQQIILDTREATEGIEVSCEDSSFENLDLWYSFTMPFNGQLEINGVFGVNKLALFDSCGGMELACQIADGFFDSLSQGKEYLLRYSAISQHAGRDEFWVQAFAFDSNDDCGNALEILKIDSLQTIVVDTRNATESLDASCEDSATKNLDLWYRFLMPFQGDLMFSGVNNAHNISIWDSCGGAELYCSYGDGIFSGLQDSTIYLLRYASSELSAWADSFQIQAMVESGFADNRITNSKPLSISPNPINTHAVLNWTTAQTTENKLMILDLSGKLVIQKQLGLLYAGEQELRISFPSLADGLYIVHIQTENQLFRGKMIKAGN